MAIGHRTIASGSILLILITPPHRPQCLNRRDSGVFFETTKVCVAPCAFEWPAAHECPAANGHPATHERPTGYDVASSHERAATREATAFHEIAQRSKIRVLTLRAK